MLSLPTVDRAVLQYGEGRCKPMVRRPPPPRERARHRRRWGIVSRPAARRGGGGGRAGDESLAFAAGRENPLARTLSA